MSGNDPVIRVALEWVIKAENDLKTAIHTLKLDHECPTDVVCFHAQQCVEKYVKAFLTLQGIVFPKTHDIEELFRLLPRDLEAAWDVEHQRAFTRYATVTRYPGTYDPVTLRQARLAVAMARKVRQAIRRLLPREAKPRKNRQ
jgi:HEPN domain-containing protein